MSGIGETICATLARFFERRLLQGGDTLRCEPVGYHTEFYKGGGQSVVRHLETGICIGALPLDIVERVDPHRVPEPTRIVFCYLPVSVFVTIADLLEAQVDPHGVWRKLSASGALKIDSIADNDSETWCGPFAEVEPRDVPRLVAADVTVRGSEPWSGAEFGIALHVLSRHCRPAEGQAQGVLEIRAPETPELDVDCGVQLVEAAGRGDVAAVRKCLAARADPDARDARGWTALHAASARRPCPEVLGLLLRVCDVCARTRQGELPADLADKGNHQDTASALRDKMRCHEKGKYLLI